MRLYAIETGNFKLDGGAMFGVVPKPLWEKTNPADDKNRIDMAARCLLIEDSEKLILIDTGLGNKQNKKFFSHYNLWGNYSLESSIKQAGFHPNQITDVLFTHLHFDHVGGAIIKNKKGIYEPAFKNARFWVHQTHWEWAKKPNAREKASFLPENILPLKESGQLNFIDHAVTPLGFDVILVDGHTEKQMLPIIKYRNKTIVFAADLIPTVGHLPIPYVMGYDTRPLLTLKEKDSFLQEAVQNEYLLFLEHDCQHELISLKNTDRGVRLAETFTLDNYFNCQ